MLTVSTVTEPLQALYAPVREDLRLVERIFDEEIAGDLPFVDELCETVRSYRGKMLRPGLLLLAARACGEMTAAHPTLAAVVELVHMATLVHDDVLDEANERRRQPTVNNIAGNEAAVLLGDYLISHAFHLCSSLESQYASRKIGATTNRVCEGELLQNHYRGRLDLSEAQYFEVISRKTAALTATACELGAHFAGASDGAVDAMRGYGLSAGIAFQIVDDVLDVVGDQATVGKTLGRDAGLGKLTLPTIHCLSVADADTAERLRGAVKDNGPGSAEVIRDCLSRTGSVDHALSVAREYVVGATLQLDTLPAGDAKASLTALAEFIIGRRF